MEWKNKNFPAFYQQSNVVVVVSLCCVFSFVEVRRLHSFSPTLSQPPIFHFQRSTHFASIFSQPFTRLLSSSFDDVPLFFAKNFTTRKLLTPNNILIFLLQFYSCSSSFALTVTVANNQRSLKCFTQQREQFTVEKFPPSWAQVGEKFLSQKCCNFFKPCSE